MEELKERVCKANKQLRDSGLVILTWGNVSAIDREKGLIVIKPSGVSYDELTPDKMVVVNMDGKVVEGNLNPSSDTPTHLVLYQAFTEIGAVVHTHSRYATIWAQAGLDIVAYGTTHADYFFGDIPCTMQMTEEQIVDDYERNTGIAITDTFQRRRLGCMEMQACLVAQHGPFVWGKDPEAAVENAVVLEEIAHMAVYNSQFQFGLTRISEPLLNKHYLRKHGENAYYGQTFGLVTDIVQASDKNEENDPNIRVEPSKHTVAL
ncbi:MAG: L-ribulose-5-phosphate 4-epimerase, partial [Ruminiclostridium sp.]|nr:L-ribulose-5-phosphate 4-epimerase [Ruminiclostridium sp.]